VTSVPGKEAIESPPAVPMQHPAPARRRRNRHAQHLRWVAKWITRTELSDLLAQGFSQADIARLKNVHNNQVHRAVRVLTDDVNERLRIISHLAAENRRLKVPVTVPQRPEGQVDLVDTMLSTLRDFQGARAWLDTAEGQELSKPRQISYILQIGEAMMRWCSQFVDIRHKLLELIAVDTWITELTEMLQDVQREHAPVLQAAGINLRQNFLDRIRGKILGRAVDTVTKELVAEVAHVEPGNGASAEG
jgi:hypothetical protein